MKIKAIYRHEIVYKNGKSPLAIRFTHQRTHKTVSLGISVELHYWDKETETIAANCPERAALQSQIDNMLAGYRKKIQRLEALDIPVTFDTLFETDKSRWHQETKVCRRNRLANIPASKILQQNGRHHIPQNAETFKKRILKLQLTRS